jgi:hypothetical protein
MSIIRDYNEGKTQLNKLKFKSTMGAGHPGNPPLVTRDIPIEPADRKSPDQRNAVERRADDVTRLTKLFGRPEGLGLLANNTNLNSAVDMSYTVQGSIKDKISALADSNIGGALLDTAGTLGSTLLQAGVNGTGTHFVKGKPFGKRNSDFNKTQPAISNFGDPGSVKVKYNGKAGTNLSQKITTIGTKTAAVDGVNMVGPYKDTQPLNDPDLVKFLFEVVQPGEKKNIFLHFRAYVDSFSDNYTGNWNESQYIGRGEKFFTYGGFDRSFDISFKTSIASKKELVPVYKKLTYLASTTAPTYGLNDLMKGTYVRLSLGDYISDTPGIISTVSYNWNSRYNFEVDKKGYYDQEKVQQLPHVLEAQISFKPIHTFTPQTGLKHFITNPTEGDNLFFGPSEEVNVGKGAFGSYIEEV